MRLRNRLIRAAAMVLALAVLLLAVRTDDTLSCKRSNSVRMSQMGYAQYAADAAVARDESARAEARTNPVQAQIDRAAAAKFRIDAGRTRIHLIPCGGFFPDAT